MECLCKYLIICNLVCLGNITPEDLLDEYISDIISLGNSLNSTSLVCDKHFALVNYTCPDSIGNRFHEILNSFAFALISNRILALNIEKNLCDKYLIRSPWILSYDVLLNSMSKSKCSNNINSFTPVDNLNSYSTVIPLANRTRAELALACCPVDELLDRFVYIGRLERQEMYAYYFRGNALSASSRNRSSILFSEGSDYAYGLMFRKMFSFSTSITDANRMAEFASRNDSEINPVPINQTIYFTLAVHLRHPRPHDFGNHAAVKEESCIIEAVQKAINNSLIGQASTQSNRDSFRCTMLISSDREEAIRRLERLAKKIQCSAVTAYRHWPKQRTTRFKNDHGLWTDSRVVLSDVELLSHADHFIGSYESTFSMLIGSLIRTNGKNTSFNWLPLCSTDHFIGSDYFPTHRSHSHIPPPVLNMTQSVVKVETVFPPTDPHKSLVLNRETFLWQCPKCRRNHPLEVCRLISDSKDNCVQ